MSTPAARIADLRLDGRNLASLVKSLSAAERTGVLTVRAHSVVRTVSLREGQPVFATSNDRDERFNGVLLQKNLVSLPDLMRAVEKMVRESRRLGEILVREGMLTQAKVAEGLRFQITDILCHVLPIRDGDITFSEQPVPPHDDIGFRTPVNSLIREALFRVQAFHRIMEEVGGTSAVFVLSDSWRDEVATAGLSGEQERALDHLSEPCTLDQICERSEGMHDFDVCRLVWVLLTIGAIKRME